ncbi:MAG: indole-3-glycerol phosphate synthase TrpC [Alphaproteobacteria bacterium]|nr:indole-3-glycerol phosphate synthase TrpC [Alphaproteobacteria bacterium]
MNKLQEICEKKREHIAERKAVAKVSELEMRAQGVEAPRGFAKALSTSSKGNGIAIIAEVKKASPSKGLIRERFSPPVLARSYQAGGATCLSVLTDMPYFQGEDSFLMAARAACSLPVLRKDFMLDPYQILESRVLGADCILLIMAALNDAQAKELEDAAFALNMDVLIEVHDEPELQRALAHLKSPLIGVNNRNLKTLEVDLTTSEALTPHIPQDRIAVCESGISTPKDIARMKMAGIHCFLVGESLMRQEDVATATRALMGGVI